MSLIVPQIFHFNLRDIALPSLSLGAETPLTSSLSSDDPPHRNLPISNLYRHQPPPDWRRPLHTIHALFLPRRNNRLPSNRRRWDRLPVHAAPDRTPSARKARRHRNNNQHLRLRQEPRPVPQRRRRWRGLPERVIKEGPRLRGSGVRFQSY